MLSFLACLLRRPPNPNSQPPNATEACSGQRKLKNKGACRPSPIPTRSTTPPCRDTPIPSRIDSSEIATPSEFSPRPLRPPPHLPPPSPPDAPFPLQREPCHDFKSPRISPAPDSPADRTGGQKTDSRSHKRRFSRAAPAVIARGHDGERYPRQRHPEVSSLAPRDLSVDGGSVPASEEGRWRPGWPACRTGRVLSGVLTASRKLVIIGDGACGKTSLLSVFTLGYFPTVSPYPTNPPSAPLSSCR